MCLFLSGAWKISPNQERWNITTHTVYQWEEYFLTDVWVFMESVLVFVFVVTAKIYLCSRMININDQTGFPYKYKLRQISEIAAIFWYSTQSQHHPTTHLSSIFVINLFFPKKKKGVTLEPLTEKPWALHRSDSQNIWLASERLNEVLSLRFGSDYHLWLKTVSTVVIVDTTDTFTNTHRKKT